MMCLNHITFMWLRHKQGNVYAHQKCNAAILGDQHPLPSEGRSITEHSGYEVCTQSLLVWSRVGWCTDSGVNKHLQHRRLTQLTS